MHSGLLVEDLKGLRLFLFIAALFKMYITVHEVYVCIIMYIIESNLNIERKERGFRSNTKHVHRTFLETLQKVHSLTETFEQHQNCTGAVFTIK